MAGLVNLVTSGADTGTHLHHNEHTKINEEQSVTSGSVLRSFIQISPFEGIVFLTPEFKQLVYTI